MATVDLDANEPLEPGAKYRGHCLVLPIVGNLRTPPPQDVTSQPRSALCLVLHHGGIKLASRRGRLAVVNPLTRRRVQDRGIELVPVQLAGFHSRKVDLDHRDVALAHLGALFAVDRVVDQEFHRQIETLIPDESVGLQRADPVLG